MHAIARELKERSPELNVLYLSAEQFMYRFITALRERKMMDFKLLFRSVDVLMVDDVQFIGGKDSTQEEFFHTFNALVDGQKQIIISADRAPGEVRAEPRGAAVGPPAGRPLPRWTCDMSCRDRVDPETVSSLCCRVSVLFPCLKDDPLARSSARMLASSRPRRMSATSGDEDCTGRTGSSPRTNA